MPTVQVNSYGELQDALDVLSRAPVTAWDSETAPRIPSNDPKIRKERALDPFQNELVLIQASDGTNTYLFHKPCGWEYLKGFLEDESKLKIGHNLKFDISQFAHHLGIYVKNIWDTMVAHRLINCGLGKRSDLGSVAYEYTGIRLDKSIAGTFENDVDLTDEQAAYGAQDVDVLIPIYYRELEDIKGQEKVAALEMLVTPVLSRIELAGFLIDKELWMQLLAEFQDEERQAASRLFGTLLPKNMSYLFKGWEDATSPLFSIDQLFDGMSPSSTKQLGEILNFRLEREGYKKIRENRKWPDQRNRPILPATSQFEISTFRAACRDYDLPIPGYIEALLKHRKWEKLIASFGMNLIKKVSEDSRLHPYFNQLVVTGRMSCRNPNLQQIPKRDESATRLRRCFIASPGKTLVVADYSQIELRLLAEMAQEKKMIDAFLRGLDLHKRTVSIIKQIPIEEVTDRERTIYKQVGFGIPYGLGPPGLALKLDVSRNDAQRIYDEYIDVFPDLKKWLALQQYLGIRDRVASTLLGRRRYLGYSTREDEDGLDETVLLDAENDKGLQGRIRRIATNEPIQGSAADMMKYAMVFVDQELQKHGYGISLQVHDELVVEVDLGFADQAKQIVRDGMMQAGAIFLKTVPCDVEVSVRPQWGK